MKIRIKDQSIRFRLTQSEVKTFKETGKINAQTHFSQATFGYQLIRSKDLEKVQVSFQENIIKVQVPIAIATEWTDTNLVGFEENMKVDENKTLKILVEKDFQCLEQRPNEDESDNYPNPLSRVTSDE